MDNSTLLGIVGIGIGIAGIVIALMVKTKSQVQRVDTKSTGIQAGGNLSINNAPIPAQKEDDEQAG
ncbi:MAG: hypothetical protein AB7W16_23615 [Candidatus Obscuribacterales bacterium]